MNGYEFQRFDRRGLMGRRWYFRFVSVNGEKMAQSEAYNSSGARDEAIVTIKREAKTATVTDA